MTVHAYIHISDGHINITTSRELNAPGTAIINRAGFPYGPVAETGDTDALSALIRVLEWYDEHTGQFSNRTFEIHTE